MAMKMSGLAGKGSCAEAFHIRKSTHVSFSRNCANLRSSKGRRPTTISQGASNSAHVQHLPVTPAGRVCACLEADLLGDLSRNGGGERKRRSQFSPSHHLDNCYTSI